MWYTTTRCWHCEHASFCYPNRYKPWPASGKHLELCRRLACCLLRLYPLVEEQVRALVGDPLEPTRTRQAEAHVLLVSVGGSVIRRNRCDGGVVDVYPSSAVLPDIDGVMSTCCGLAMVVDDALESILVLECMFPTAGALGRGYAVLGNLELGSVRDNLVRLAHPALSTVVVEALEVEDEHRGQALDEDLLGRVHFLVVLVGDVGKCLGVRDERQGIRHRLNMWRLDLEL